jgi:hypothetical protein
MVRGGESCSCFFDAKMTGRCYTVGILKQGFSYVSNGDSKHFAKVREAVTEIVRCSRISKVFLNSWSAMSSAPRLEVLRVQLQA